MLERALAIVPRQTIYATTGIQFIAINTLYQLLSLVESRDPDLGRADRLLLMADLINYFLCDRVVAEYTNATTTQCLDVTAADVGIRDAVPDGNPHASFRRWSARHRARPTARLTWARQRQIIAPGTHDTASAVAATPLPRDGNTAYLSSGTWSLLGVELRAAAAQRRRA